MTETYTVADVLSKGIDHGRELFECNIQDVPGYGFIANLAIDEDFNLDEFEDAVKTACWEADENYRQFSPFEFFAHALNESENAEDLWEAYDKGIEEGIEDMLSHLTQPYLLAVEILEEDRLNGDCDEE